MQEKFHKSDVKVFRIPTCGKEELQGYVQYYCGDNVEKENIMERGKKEVGEKRRGGRGEEERGKN